MSLVEDRVHLLARGASALGAGWAQSCGADVNREGRAIVGGWPGTLREARAHVDVYFRRELGARGLTPLTEDELAATARETYQRAKREWLRLQRVA